MSEIFPGLPFTRTRFLTWLFREAERAGWGIADGPSFEAFPGLEHAATDYMEDLLRGPCGPEDGDDD